MLGNCSREVATARAYLSLVLQEPYWSEAAENDCFYAGIRLSEPSAAIRAALGTEACHFFPAGQLLAPLLHFTGSVHRALHCFLKICALRCRFEKKLPELEKSSFLSESLL